jgi:hypothetical protein
MHGDRANGYYAVSGLGITARCIISQVGGPFCFLRLLVHAMVAGEEGTEGTPAPLKAITV